MGKEILGFFSKNIMNIEILLIRKSRFFLFKGRSIAETQPSNHHHRYLGSNPETSEKNENNVPRKFELRTLQQIPLKFPKKRVHRASQG